MSAQDVKAWVAGQLGLPFVWGVRDCSTWVLEWLAAAADVQAYGQYAGRYATQQEAARFAAEHDLEQVLVAAGARGIAEDQLEPGDVVLVQDRVRGWWRGHVIVDQDLFAACWPARGVQLAHRALLRGSVVRCLRLPAAGGAPCLR